MHILLQRGLAFLSYCSELLFTTCLFVAQYERRKEREKEEEEDRRGAENAVREGQFMYM